VSIGTPWGRNRAGQITFSCRHMPAGVALAHPALAATSRVLKFFWLVLAFWVGIEKNGGMRGTPDRQLSMLSSLSTEDLIPADHPIRRIRAVVDQVLAGMDDVFDAMYAESGRRSVPPETLLKATVLMAMYSMRSERAFCERLNYDMLFKWFLDMPIDAKAFDATTFTKKMKSTSRVSDIASLLPVLLPAFYRRERQRPGNTVFPGLFCSGGGRI
jgi:transposase